MNDGEDKTPDAPKQQVAALPYRFGKGGLQILLITSRDSGRWVIPKGGVMKKRTGAQAAAIEALEEAGVRGAIAPTPIGSYSYEKGVVEVYPLAVAKQAKKFKEKGQRTLEWVSPEDAAGRVAEADLAALIRAFDPTPT